MKKIIVATTNQNKVKRLKALLEDYEIISLADIDTKIEEPNETAFTRGEIAIKSQEQRTIVKVVGAESKLEVRLVNRVNKLEETPGYFLAALTEARVNGEWIPYNELDEKTLVELDKDLYDFITTLLKNFE